MSTYLVQLLFFIGGGRREQMVGSEEGAVPKTTILLMPENIQLVAKVLSGTNMVGNGCWKTVDFRKLAPWNEFS